MTVTVSAIAGSSAQTSGRSLDYWGSRPIGLFRVTLDSSYATGGEPFDPKTYGFPSPVAAVFISTRWVAAATDYVFTYDHANKKIYSVDAGAESGNDDLSSVVLDVLVVGE